MNTSMIELNMTNTVRSLCDIQKTKDTLPGKRSCQDLRRLQQYRQTLKDK